MFIDEEIESVVNSVFVRYWSQSSWPYEDAQSKTDFGTIENRVSSSWVSELESAEVFGAEYIEKSKERKKANTNCCK